MNKKWTEAEKQYVIAHYNSSTDLELCQSLQALGKGHSLDSVRKFRQRLQLKKAKGRPSKVKVEFKPINLTKTAQDLKETIQEDVNKRVNEVLKNLNKGE